MLAELMICIGHAERNHAEPHVTSFAPFKRPPEVRTHDTGLVKDEGSYLSEFLPCHYFGKFLALEKAHFIAKRTDYIVGTSTGGYVSEPIKVYESRLSEL
jgi:hypothetical protein